MKPLKPRDITGIPTYIVGKTYIAHDEDGKSSGIVGAVVKPDGGTMVRVYNEGGEEIFACSRGHGWLRNARRGLHAYLPDIGGITVLNAPL